MKQYSMGNGNEYAPARQLASVIIKKDFSGIGKLSLMNLSNLCMDDIQLATKLPLLFRKILIDDRIHEIDLAEQE